MGEGVVREVPRECYWDEQGGIVFLSEIRNGAQGKEDFVARMKKCFAVERVL